MKKVITILLNVFVPLSVLLMVVAIFLPAYSITVTSPAAATVNYYVYSRISALFLGSSFFVYAFLPVGAILFYSKKDLLSNLGLALLISVGIVFIVLFIDVKGVYDEDLTTSFGAGSYLGLIGAIFAFLALALKALLIPLGKEDDEKTIQCLLRYKDLEEKGIITHEEFLTKKDSVLEKKK